MYLSKVKLNWDQAKNPYQQHRALWQLFPNRPDDERDFLYRVERLEKGQGAAVIVQSQHRPTESDLVELVALRELNLKVYSGQTLRFRLRANPVKNIKDERKGERIKNGKTFIRSSRVPLIHEEQQQDWLAKKLTGAATLNAITIQQELALNFRKPKENRSGKIQPVVFDGVLTVDDADVFLALIRKGIGPAKSFGCGMMSLAPA